MRKVNRMATMPTITKLPQSSASKGRKFVLRYDDQDGEPKELTFLRKYQAIEKARELGIFPDPGKHNQKTFADLAALCREEYRAAPFSKDSVNHTERLMDYLEDVLDGVPVRGITEQTLEAVEQKLLESRSPLVVRRAMGRLALMLEVAKGFGWATRNPFDERAPAPEPSEPRWKVRERTAPVVRVPSLEHVRRILRIDDGSGTALLICLILLAGVRPGEALALTWEDLLCTQQLISIVKSIDQDGDRLIDEEELALWEQWEAQAEDADEVWDEDLLTVQSVKTRNGLRDVPLCDLLAKRFAAYRVACGNPVKGRIFKGYDSFANPMELARRQSYDWQRTHLEEEVFTFMALRHACAALWIWMDVPEDAISTWLGHATVPFTLDVYAYLFDRQEAGDKEWPTTPERHKGEALS